jgi:hypothetical protein
MDRQAIVLRCREAVRSLRARLSLRLVARLTVALTALSLLAIGTEAVLRARLAAPADRIPTALYTRPVPWVAMVRGGFPLPSGRWGTPPWSGGFR